MLYGRLNPCYMLQSHKINFQSRIYSGPVIDLETVDDFHIRCIKWMKSSLYVVLSG